MQHPPPRISELAQKWLKGTISEPELLEFNAWYNQFNDEELPLSAHSGTPAEIKERMLSHLQQRLHREEATRPVPVRKAWLGWAAAACLGALILIAGNKYHWWQHQEAEVLSVNTSGRMQKIILPDSSIVWLKPNSHLTYPDKFEKGVRQVELKGEALFEITQRANQPFVVTAGQYTARVLGTSFNLRLLPEPNSMVLTVLTGKVAVAAQKDDTSKKETVLAARQKLVADTKQFVVKEVVPQEQSLLEKGTEYNMNFHNISFTDVIHRLEEKFNIKCHVEGQGLQYCSLTVDLTDQSLQESLLLIAATSNGRYEMQEGQVTWSGEGCRE